MTFFEPIRVLLVDGCEDRASAITHVLTEDWGADVVPCRDDPHEARAAYYQARRDNPFSFVMVEFGFAGTNHTDLCTELSSFKDTQGILILDKPTLDTRGQDIRVLWARRDMMSDDPDLRDGLLEIFGERPTVARLDYADRKDRTLESQIRHLDPRGKLTVGETTLRKLASQLLPGLGGFTVQRLTQGLSGAMVFLLSCPGYGGPNDPKQFVVKLARCGTREARNCHAEIKNYREIEEALGHRILPLIPRLRCRDADPDNPCPAQADDWLAIMYSYLGEENCIIRDFERFFLDPEACLKEAKRKGLTMAPEVTASELPKRFLDHLFDELKKGLYKDSTPEQRALWNMSEASDTGPRAFPPYRFDRQEQRKIIGSLDLLREYGESLLGKQWRQCRARVRKTAGGNRGSDELGDGLGKHYVLITPVHGDLNAKNMFMELPHYVPFLIDFASFERNGHVLQDYAMVEATIKFALMGREKGNKTKGKDLNIDELQNWCDADDALRQWPGRGEYPEDLPPRGQFVGRAFGLCRQVRNLALNVHRRLMRPWRFRVGSFRLAYDAALLYYTARAISDDSLPRVKRVFAAYSASRIAESLFQSRSRSG